MYGLEQVCASANNTLRKLRIDTGDTTTSKIQVCPICKSNCVSDDLIRHYFSSWNNDDKLVNQKSYQELIVALNR